MINFNDVAGESVKEHNANWPQIAVHLYRILIIGGFYQERQMHYLIQ